QREITMKVRNLVALAAVLFAAAPAYAADVASVVEPYRAPAPYHAWQGLYVGIQGGASLHDIDTETNLGGLLPVGLQSSSSDIAPFVGIRAGYRHQFDNGFVVGASGSIDWTDFRSTSTSLIVITSE